jgi:class 3 adenylate cyclase/tetratricopeptide (TPR) repeat protein
MMMDERQRIEQAIAAQESLRATVGDEIVDETISTLREKLAALEAPEQQRKLVTILYADIVGSTNIVKHLDPEDALEIMDGSLKRLAVPVEEHGGRVARYMGDGFKAVFGMPQAHENDPEMAIRAGLGILEAAQELGTELETQWDIEDFQLRVGVNTGLAALGGMTEAEDTVMGSTVNLAKRVESAAPPGGLLISHSTYRHVRGIFTVREHEPIEAKGFDQPVPVYWVLEVKPRAFRVQTRGVEGVETRMVGRNVELLALQQTFHDAMEVKQTHVVTVVGEAGVGKSRLLYEFDNWIELLPDEVRFFEGRGRQETQGLPFALLKDVFAFRFQLQESDKIADLWEKVESGFGDVFGEGDDGRLRAHIIGQLLGFDFLDSQHLKGVLEDPQQLHERATTYLAEYFKGMSEMAPVVIILEDIHWADDSSLSLINRLARRIPGQRILIVCATRQRLFDRRPYWGEGLEYHTQLELRPLSKAKSRQLVKEILKRVKQVPEALQELVVKGTEGNPFYTEELLKMLIDGGVIITGNEQWQIKPERLVEVDVPETLTGVLQARLEGLPSEERNSLQQASVVGHIFWDEAVEYISNESTAADTISPQRSTDKYLSSLRARELIYHREDSVFTDADEYTFKHALLRDVTYESILKRVRKAYHGLVAEWLIQHSEERIWEYTGLIADHLELAGKTEQATIYLYQAGERAANRYANDEALRYFTRALALTPEDDLAGHFDLLLAREGVLNLIGDRVAQERDLNSLKQIAESIGDVRRQADTALRRMIYLVETSNFAEAEESATDAISLAQAAIDLHCEAKVNLHWGRSLWHHGKSVQAISRLETALHLAQAHHFQEIEAEVFRNLGVAYRGLGDTDRFLSLTQQALIKYREGGNLKAEAAALNNLGVFFSEDDFNAVLAKDYFEQSCEIACQIGDRVMEGYAIFNLGQIATDCHQYDLAIKHYQQSTRIAREVRDELIFGASMLWLGKCLSYQGEFDKANAIYDEVVEYSQQIGLKFGEIIVSIFLMDLYCSLGDFVSAERYHQQFYDLWGEREFGIVETRALIWSSWMRYQMGEQQSAIKLSQQAIESMGKKPKHVFRPIGLIIQGYALTALGNLQEAERVFQGAVKSAIDTERPRLAMQVLAGLAQTAMARAESKQALNYIEEVISYMEAEISSYGHPFDGTLDPFHIYLTIFQVLKANNDSRAEAILTDAYNLLETRAVNISDENLRYCFLNNLAANREIVEEYEKSGLVGLEESVPP